MHNQVQDSLIQHHCTDSLPVEQLFSVDSTPGGELIESNPVEGRVILVRPPPLTSNIVLSQPSHIGADQHPNKLPEMLLGILAFAYSVSGTDMLTAYNNSVREELFDLICLFVPKTIFHHCKHESSWTVKGTFWEKKKKICMRK